MSNPWQVKCFMPKPEGGAYRVSDVLNELNAFLRSDIEYQLPLNMAFDEYGVLQTVVVTYQQKKRPLKSSSKKTVTKPKQSEDTEYTGNSTSF